MFQAILDPVGGNIYLSACVAALPIIALLFMLIVMRIKASVAAAISLGIALLVAVFAFDMPAHLALLSALEGSCYGVFPIAYILVVAVWFYQITVSSGRFDDLRKFFNELGDHDPRIQALVIAFCFGALLEAISGFGAPVAIVAAMLIALGFSPMKSAVIALVANTVPVAFSGAGTPLIVAGLMVSGGDATLANAVSTTVGIILAYRIPFYALALPFVLLGIMDGLHGIKDCWPIALVCGASFAVTCWWCALFFAFEMAALSASLVSIGLSALFLRFWKPRKSETLEKRLQLKPEKTSEGSLTPRRILMALFPYMVVVVIFTLAKTVCAGFIDGTTVSFAWPGLAGKVFNASGADPGTTFSLNWLSTPGTLLLISTVIVIIVYHFFDEKGLRALSFHQALVAFGDTFIRMKSSLITIILVLAFAYVVNFSGQIACIGQVLAQTGIFFAFLSPVIGWVGTVVTGSCTSSNALFSFLQYHVGETAFPGISSEFFVASNTLGSMAGKMISPESLAIAAAAVEEPDSAIARKTLVFSLVLLLIICTGSFVMVMLQI